MYFDGSLMKKGVGAGLVFILPLKVRMRYMVRIHFPSSNNVDEYEALINGLRIAIELGIRWLDVRGDSQLVINQVMKELSCHNAKRATYYREVRQLEDKFDGLELNHIPRHLNEAAMCWRKRRLAESRCRRVSSPVISISPRSTTRSQNRTMMGCLPSARGLTSWWLHLTPKSWSLTRIQRQSPTLRLEDALPRLPPP